MGRFTQSRFFGYLLLAATMVGWGPSFAMNRWLLEATPIRDEPWPGLSLSVLRFAALLPVLTVWSAIIVRRRGGLSWREGGQVTLLGLLSVVIYHLLTNTAQTLAGSTLIAVLHQLIPVIAFAAGLVFLRERLSVVKFLGLVLATAGAVTYSMNEEAETAGANVSLAVVLVLVMGLDWTVYMVLAKRALERWSDVELTVLASTAATVMLLLVGEASRPLGYGVDWTILARLSPPAWAMLLYVSLTAGLVCYVTYNAGLKRVEASRAAVFEYLLVPVAMLAGLCLPEPWHEGPTLVKVVSAAVIIGGVYLVTWQPPPR